MRYRILFALLVAVLCASSAFASPQGEYKAFTYTSPLGCLGLTTEYGGIPDCYDFNQFDSPWVWSPNLQYFVPKSLPRLKVAQLPPCSSTLPDVQYGFAIATDSTNQCVAGNALTGGGTGNTCVVACVQSSTVWNWTIIGGVGGSGAASCPQLPALTGDTTTLAGSCATTTSGVQNNSLIPIRTTTSGAATSLALASSLNQFVTLHDTTTFTFTNAPSDGNIVRFQLTQSNGGSHTVTWPVSVKWTGGSAPTLTTANGAVDQVQCLYDGTALLYSCSSVLNFH